MLRKSEIFVNRKLTKAFEATKKTEKKKTQQNKILNNICFENLQTDLEPDIALLHQINDEKINENDKEIEAL